MCLVHLFDSWYSLSLALPHSKYFYMEEPGFPEALGGPVLAGNFLVSWAMQTWRDMSSVHRRQHQKQGKVYSVPQTIIKAVWKAGAFQEVSTSYFNTGRILDSDNTRFCSSSWGERGYICDLANSQHSQWISSEDAPGKDTDWAAVGGHGHIWALENNTSWLAKECWDPKTAMWKQKAHFWIRGESLCINAAERNSECDQKTVWFLLC